jgi:myo-inositol-1(or 4)-monophosphatase
VTDEPILRTTTVDNGYSAHLTAVATAAATAVGDLLRAGFRTRPPVGYKRDFHDLVTAYDQQAEDRIRAVLMLREPDSRIVGEEGGTTGDGSVHWYVDPIDGTVNFAHGLPYFCTSVAAVVGCQVVAGAVYDPVRDDLFTASTSGAWCNGTALTSTGASTEAEAMLLFGPGPSLTDRTPALVSGFRAVRVTGSAALNLAHVAAGWSDAYLGAGLAPWDVAAGALLVTSAGGSYVGFQPGEHDERLAPWQASGCLATVGTLDLTTVVADLLGGHTVH